MNDDTRDQVDRVAQRLTDEAIARTQTGGTTDQPVDPLTDGWTAHLKQHADLIAERDRLRNAINAILDGLVGLDSDDAYVAITTGHLGLVRAALKPKTTPTHHDDTNITDDDLVEMLKDATAGLSPGDEGWTPYLNHLHTLIAERDDLIREAFDVTQQRDWYKRLFVATNQDRRFAWRELKHENHVAVERKKELDRLRAVIAEYQRTHHALDHALDDGQVEAVEPQMREWQAARQALLDTPTDGAQPDRLRAVVDAAELLVAALDAGIIRDELTLLRERLDRLGPKEGT